jgi:hypothetical protein
MQKGRGFVVASCESVTRKRGYEPDKEGDGKSKQQVMAASIGEHR